MAQLKLILLDFDGTLVNTGRANATSYVEALREEGITLTVEEYNRRYFGWRCPEFLADLGLTDPVQMKRIRHRKIEIYPTHFDLISLNKPLWDFVQSFRKTGGKAMVVSTGHPDNIRNAMTHLGIQDGFDGILTSDAVKNTKPHPDCFLKAMEIAGATPEETLIFEDSPIGLEAARRTGATYVKVELPF